MDNFTPDGRSTGGDEPRVLALRQRHADFDRKIQELQGFPSASPEIAALKVEKLHIKDEIARLTD